LGVITVFSASLWALARMHDSFSSLSRKEVTFYPVSRTPTRPTTKRLGATEA